MAAYTNRAVAPMSRTRPLLMRALENALLAGFAYVPLLATKPGILADDTKQYLYLDPGRLLSSALSMWDPSVAAGTVTHQNIGYLFPQGPFYWVFAQLGVPMWVAQRLWMGTLVFAAGAGRALPRRRRSASAARAQCRRARLRAQPLLASSTSSRPRPYSSPGQVSAGSSRSRCSPCAGVDGATPLCSRFVVALVGATNATSLIYAGIAPVAWLFYAVVVLREAPATSRLRRRGEDGRALARGLTVLDRRASRRGRLRRQRPQVHRDPARHRGNITRLRGRPRSRLLVLLRQRPARALEAGGREAGGERLAPATSFAVPLLAVLAPSSSRWRAKAFFVLLVLVGLVLAVGMHPYPDPSIIGRGLKAFMSGSSVGLALRSSDRATPLVVLGFAVLLGAGATAVWSRFPRAGSPRPVRWRQWWSPTALRSSKEAPSRVNFERPEEIPSYYAQAASLP